MLRCIAPPALHPRSPEDSNFKLQSGQVYYAAEVYDHEGQAKKRSRASRMKVPK